MPYEDLEPIASLKIGKIVEQVSRDGATKLSATIGDLARRGLGHPEGGPVIAARMRMAIEGAERLCQGVTDTWLGLILERNKGRITRDDVNFILAKVDSCAQAQGRNIASSGSKAGWTEQQAQTWTGTIVGKIRRDLEIKIREQDAFPKQRAAPDIRFVAFLRAFGETWLTKMSGPLTVPFAIAALFMSGYPRLIFAVLAMAAAVFSSYHVWRRAKLDKESRET